MGFRQREAWKRARKQSSITSSLKIDRILAKMAQDITIHSVSNITDE